VVALLLPKHKKVITICGVRKRKNPCDQKYVREEIITSQIQKEIKKVSLPDDWIKWMIEENRKDQSSEIQSSTLFADNTKAEISLLDSKIEKLMTCSILKAHFRWKNIERLKVRWLAQNSFSKRNYRLLSKKRIIGSNLPKSF
jgi:hypothetical protein